MTQYHVFFGTKFKQWYSCALYKHTCEPPDGRINSPVFLGRLPISNILPNSPEFYMFTSQMCSLHHVHLGQRSKMQLELIEGHTCGLYNPLHSAKLVDSHFKICFNNFIYPPWVDNFTLGWSLFEYLLGFNSKFQNIIFFKNKLKKARICVKVFWQCSVK